MDENILKAIRGMIKEELEPIKLETKELRNVQQEIKNL